MLRVFVIVLCLELSLAKIHLKNCLDDKKQCVGLPRGCIGEKCHYAYSAVSNGTHVEIEMVGYESNNKDWLASAYSNDTKMGNDFVVFCVRDQSSPELKGGLAINDDHSNRLVGTVDDLEVSDEYNFELKIIEHKFDDTHFYCKMSHRIEPITKKFGTTKIDILMAKGVWMNNMLSYHGKSRQNVGKVDLGMQKKRRTSAANNAAILTTFITAILSYFV